MSNFTTISSDKLARLIGTANAPVLIDVRTEEDFAWLQKRLEPDVRFENRSADYAGLAIQGPKVVELFRQLFRNDAELPARKNFSWS